MCIFHFKGSGKKTLARKLAQIWKCIYIEGKHTLYLEHCIGFVIPFVLEYPFFLVIQNDMLLIASKTTDEDQVIILSDTQLLKNSLLGIKRFKNCPPAPPPPFFFFPQKPIYNQITFSVM